MWRLAGHRPALDLLRARGRTRQAGFTAEYIPQAGMHRRPILISDGPQHDEQRRAVGRFFAPSVVAQRYVGLMEQVADRLLAAAHKDGTIRLDELALYYAVEVTAEVVGLTPPSRGMTGGRRDRRIRSMAHRLEAFFEQPPFDLSRADLGRTRRQWVEAAVKGLVPLARFTIHDVLPAVRHRRRHPAADVMSHLITQGYTLPGMIVEAVTYGTAGMVTTREFICMAAWHLLTHDALRDRYLSSDTAQRHRLLEELIRLEPVVGHLYRRVDQPVSVSDSDTTWCIPEGALVDIDVRHANSDPTVWGEDAFAVNPDRCPMTGARTVGLSFGEGDHRCPGQPLAIWETEVLLTALLGRSPRLLSDPTITWDDLVSGYQLRGMVVELGTAPHDGTDQ